MRALQIAGAVLIAIGVLTLAYRGFSYTTREKVIDVGAVEITRTEREFVPLSPILGGAAVVAGAVLLFVGARRAR
jgi:hypothetical protein